MRILLLLIFSLKAFSNSTGQSLLDSYSCRSVGTQTTRQLSLLSNLSSTLEPYRHREDCRDSVLRNIDFTNLNQITRDLGTPDHHFRIKEQESLIEETMQELKFLENPPSNFDPSLHPDPEVLRSDIKRANELLRVLKGQVQIEDRRQAERRRKIGLENVANIVSSLSSALSKQKDDCLAQGDDTWWNILGGVIGATGFLFNQGGKPAILGSYVSLAGQIASDAIQLVKTIKYKKNLNKIKEPEEAFRTLFGISCAYESLSSEKCYLTRNKSISANLGKNLFDNPLAEVNSLYQCIGSDQLNIMPETARENIKAVKLWLEDSIVSANLSTNSGAEGQKFKNQERATFTQLFNRKKNNLDEIESKTIPYEGENRNIQRYKLLKPILSSFEINGYEGEIFNDLGITKSSFTPEEKDKMFISLLIEKEQDQIFAELRAAYIAEEKKVLQEEANRYNEGKINQSTVFQLSQESALSMFNGLQRRIGDLTIPENYNRAPKPIQKIFNQLKNKETIDIVRRNLLKLDNRVKGFLAPPKSKLVDIQILSSFFGNDQQDRENTPIERLRTIYDFITSIKSNPNLISNSTFSINEIDVLFEELNFLFKGNERDFQGIESLDNNLHIKGEKPSMSISSVGFQSRLQYF